MTGRDLLDIMDKNGGTLPIDLTVGSVDELLEQRRRDRDEQAREDEFDTLHKYLELEQQMTAADDPDTILDEMDDLWYLLSDEDIKLLDDRGDQS